MTERRAIPVSRNAAGKGQLKSELTQVGCLGPDPTLVAPLLFVQNIKMLLQLLPTAMNAAQK